MINTTQTPDAKSHKQIWWQWHLKNKGVYARFVEIAFDLINQGHKRYSQDAILHVIRFEINRTRPNEKDQFKINNNFTPYYARLFQLDFPEFKEFFKIRELISETKQQSLKPTSNYSHYAH